MKPLDPVLQRRLEATAFLVAAVAAHGLLGFSWGVFAACFFLPDLSIALYFVNTRVGGMAYNLAHCFVWPLAIGSFGVLAEAPGAQQTALIWGAHIAFDRALGWGLKYEQGFSHTDMGVKTLPFPNRILDPEPGPSA